MHPNVHFSACSLPPTLQLAAALADSESKLSQSSLPHHLISAVCSLSVGIIKREVNVVNRRRCHSRSSCVCVCVFLILCVLFVCYARFQTGFKLPETS